MANYPKELLDLVQEYLTDGVISAKERQVLINKAVSLGVDANEFDLYIDAQEQKLQNVAAEAAKQQRGRLCPFCQASLPMFADKCPECGGNITPEASDELKEILENLENALVEMKSGNDIARSKALVEKYSRRAKLYYGKNAKVVDLLAEIDAEIKKKEQQMKSQAIIQTIMSFIKGYPKTCIAVAILLVGLIISLFSTSAEDEAKDLMEDVIEMVEDGKHAEANKILKAYTIPSGEFSGDEKIQIFDPAFLATVEALYNSGAIDDANSLALAYKSKINYDYYWERSSVYQFINSKEEFTSATSSILNEIWDLIDQNNTVEADKKLKRIKKSEGSAEKFIKEYDEAFLAVIEAYWNQRNYNAAESLALSYRSKINDDYNWKYKSAVYKFLEAKYKTIRRNFAVFE